MKAMPSMPSSSGTGKKQSLVKKQSGIVNKELVVPRAKARKLDKLKKAQIALGRQVRVDKHAQLKLNLVLDTSSSMSDKSGGFMYIEKAKGIAMAWYLEMNQRERDSLTVYEYTRNLRKLNNFGDVQQLYPNGGTNLNCLIPELKRASKNDRWLVITDGDLPDFSDIPSDAKMAVISLNLKHHDSRVVILRDNPESERELKAKLKELLK